MPNSTAPTYPITLASLQAFLTRIYKSRFMRNVVVVASGTAGAQAITTAFSPIITRLYGPEAFGLLGTFMAIVAIIAPVVALSFPIAIVLPKEDREARGIAKLSMYIAMIIATIIFLLFLTAGDWIVKILRVQQISTFILLIPLVIVFTALKQIAQQWLIRKRQFRRTARAAVLNALTINSLKSGIGLFKPFVAVLIVLSALGNAIHAGLLAWATKNSAGEYKDQEKSDQHLSMWGLAKKYYDFPLFRSPQNFINTISQNLPVLMLAALFGPAPAGFYALCRRFLGIPSQLIGKSVGDVFYPRITEAAHRGEVLTLLILKATLLMAVIGIVPFALVAAFGPWLFGFVFGVDWVGAGEYARWLALMMFFSFVNKPVVVAVPVLDLQKKFLVYEILIAGLRLLSMYIGFFILRDDMIGIYFFSILSSIAYIILIIWVILCSLFQESRGFHG